MTYLTAQLANRITYSRAISKK